MDSAPAGEFVDFVGVSELGKCDKRSESSRFNSAVFEVDWGATFSYSLVASTVNEGKLSEYVCVKMLTSVLEIDCCIDFMLLASRCEYFIELCFSR